MALFNILIIGAAAFYFYLFVVLQSMKVRGREHRILGFAAIALFQWTLTAYFVYNGENIALLRLLLPISCIGLFFFFPLNLHFAFALAYDRPIPKVFFLFLYGIGTAFALTQFLHPVSMRMCMDSNGAVGVTQAIGTEINTAWVIYAFTCWIMSLFFYFLYRRKTVLNRDKKQSALLISTLICIVVLLPVEYYIPFFVSEWRIPPQSPLLFTPWAGVMLYSIWKYGFLRISPGLLTKKILDSVEDIVLLYSMHGEVVYRNQKATSVLGKTKIGRNENTRIVEKAIRPLLNERASWSLHYPEKRFIMNIASQEKEIETTSRLLIPAEMNKEVSEHTPESGKKRIDRESKGKRYTVDFRVKPLLDRFDDPLGVLVTGTVITRIDEFLDKFRLTKREAEIVEYLMAGRTVGEIAYYLNITERTVKTHITNIYFKTGVLNRVELVTMVMSECR